MVSLENYYDNVDVMLDDSTNVSERVKSLLDKVVMKLPDEEQFRKYGLIGIGLRDWVIDFWKEDAQEYDHSPNKLLVIREGNLGIDFREKMEESSYAISIAVDNLAGKSDDYIEGLIVSKLSEWSYAFRELNKTPNWENLGEKEREIRLKPIMKGNATIGSEDREEYERKVDEEAERLGFSKELDAYDVPPAVEFS